jgi:hypothetical protein
VSSLFLLFAKLFDHTFSNTMLILMNADKESLLSDKKNGTMLWDAYIAGY